MVTPAALPEASLFHASLMPPPLPGAQDDMVVDPPDPSLPVSGVDVPMSSEADGPAADMEVEAATLLEPPPLKIQALRPTVHPPQPRPTEKKIDRPNFTRPALFQLFAEAFRPLPTLFSRFWGKRYSGWEIFTWLFPSMESKAPVPTPADATPSTPDTPFQAFG